MPTPFFADLVRELAQEGGTGPLTPTGAVPGHRRFADAVPRQVFSRVSEVLIVPVAA